MTVTVQSFQQQFKEFRETDPTLVEQTISLAQRWVSPAVWGAQTDDGVSYLTAHFLEISPRGTNTRLKPGEKTTYQVVYEEMRRSVVVAAFGVCGGGGSGG